MDPTITFAYLIDHFQPVIKVIDSTFYGVSQEALIILAIFTPILAGGSIFLMIISLLFLRTHYSVISDLKKEIKKLAEYEGLLNEIRILKRDRSSERLSREKNWDGEVGIDLPISGDV